MPAPRIAVIAVHGVADQEPNASSREIASLLGRLAQDDRQPFCYSTFTEHAIDVPVRPLPPATADRETLFYTAAADSGQPIDIRFMDALLDGYEVDGDATFRTLRLEGKRTASDGEPEAVVHVYEMYWADLSRLGNGAIRIFGEFYQVLLHLGSLGKHVTSAAVGADSSKAGRVFKGAEAFAAWVLSGPIAVFNLFMLASALLVLADVIGTWQRPVAVVLTGVTMIVGAGIVFLRAKRLPWWASAIVLSALAAAVGVLEGVIDDGVEARRLLGVVVLGHSILLLAYLALRYERYRPYSMTASAFGLGIVAATGVVSLFAERPTSTMLMRAGFRIVEALYLLLHVSWVAFILALWVAFVSGEIFRRRSPVDDARARAVWTSRLALGLAAFGFLVTTILLWAAVYVAVGEERLTQASYGTLAFSREWFGAEIDTRQFVKTVLVESVGSGFIAMLALLSMAVLVAAWALGPIVWAEVRPPGDHRRTADLGRWLNNAFPLLNLAGALVFVAFALMLPLGGVLDVSARANDGMLSSALAWMFSTNTDRVQAVVMGIGALMAVPAAGLFVLRGRFDMFAAGFRAPLDVALDVDNYLREHPRGQTPRARLCARYWSLLGHVTDARPGYDAIVIIAHSQGTVLTADLLRYMRRHPHASLPLPPVLLFTMGSPLRQLYGLRFPHLYAWSRHAENTPAQIGHRIGATQPPLPSELGVCKWVNAYRSGDYVGRWLWRADPCENQFDPAGTERAAWRARRDLHHGVESSDASGTRREFCIGAGAHTHYWDETAPEIAVELDALIAEAAANAGDPEWRSRARAVSIDESV